MAEQEAQGEVGADCEGQEEGRGAEGAALDPLEVEDYGMVYEPRFQNRHDLVHSVN